MANQMPARKKKESDKPEIDWALRKAILNCVAASVVISVMTLILAKPADMTYVDLLQMTNGNDDFPVMTIP